MSVAICYPHSYEIGIKHNLTVDLFIKFILVIARQDMFLVPSHNRRHKSYKILADVE